jgi:hypothetical protein
LIATAPQWCDDPEPGGAPVDVTATLDAEVSPEALYAVVADLSTYPDWLDIVPRAQPVDPDPADEGPAWSVDLRGQLGPLRRSKRIRMVRTVAEAPRTARFERREHDDRSHSDWVLQAVVEPGDGSPGPVVSHLVMSLHYGGSMWMPMLDRLLADEIERSRARLLSVLEAHA